MTLAPTESSTKNGAPARTAGLVPIVDPAKLDGAVGWAAKAFVLLGGLATFFGVKDGALTRMIRQAPGQSVAILALLGVGLVLALIAPAVLQTWTLDVGWVLGGVATVGVVTAWTAPDLPGAPSDRGWWLPPVIGVACIVALRLLAKWRGVPDLAWQVGAILVAVACVAGGLYAATKLVLVDSLRVITTPVTASVQRGDQGNTLTVTITPVSVDQPVRVAAQVTDAKGSSKTLVDQVVSPEQAGSAPMTITTEIPHGDWNQVRIGRCIHTPGSALGAPCPLDDATTLALPEQPATLGASLVPDPEKKQAGVTVSGVQPAYRVVRVEVLGPGQSVLGSATLTPGADGAVQWTATVPATAGQGTQVQARTCDTRVTPESCWPAQTLATLP